MRDGMPGQQPYVVGSIAVLLRGSWVPPTVHEAMQAGGTIYVPML